MSEKIKRIVVCCKWVFLVSGMICLTTGSSTKHWQGNDSSHEGLWEMCTRNLGCSSIKFRDSKGIQFHYMQKMSWPFSKQFHCIE